MSPGRRSSAASPGARRAHPHAESTALRRANAGRISRDGIDRLLRSAETAGVQGFPARGLRHTLAHSWLSAGGCELRLPQLAGGV